MGNTTVSLTDEIYAELVDGLKTGLDWPHFLAKHGASKGPLYNAIGRFFNDMEARVRALSEVQGNLDSRWTGLDCAVSCNISMRCVAVSLAAYFWV